MLVIDEGSFRPKLARDFVAREQLAGPLQKHEENLEGLSVELDAHSLPSQFTCGGVRFKDSKAIALCRPNVAFQVRHGFRQV